MNKIKKYLIRQTFSETSIEDSEAWKSLKKMTFLEFLYQVGMFNEQKPLSKCNQGEIENAKERYFDAISVSVKGTGTMILKREVKPD